MALGEEIGKLANDADLLTMDVDLGAEATDVALRAKMRGHQSWTAGTLLSLDKSQAPAPEAFWQLPADAMSGAFYHPSDPARWTDIWMVLGQLADGWLRHAGVPAADRASVATLLDPSRTISATTTTASGRSEGASWTMIVVEETDRTTQAFRNLAAAWARPKVREQIEKYVLPALEVDSIGLRATAPPAGLPKGAIDLEASVSWPRRAKRAAKVEKTLAKADDAKPKRWSGHLIAFADKGRTWIGLGGDRKALVKVLASAKDAARGAGMDADKAKAELVRFRSERLVAGGYFTLAGMFGGLAMDAMTANTPHAMDFMQAFARGPHQGKSPATYSVGVSTQGALTLTTSLHIPKAMVEDVVVAVASLHH